MPSFWSDGVPGIVAAKDTLDDQIIRFKKHVLAAEAMQMDDVAGQFKNTNERMYEAYKQIDANACAGDPQDKPNDSYASRYSSWMQNYLTTVGNQVSSGISKVAQASIIPQLKQEGNEAASKDFDAFTKAHPTGNLNFNVGKLVDWSGGADIKINKRAAACQLSSSKSQPASTTSGTKSTSGSKSTASETGKSASKTDTITTKAKTSSAATAKVTTCIYDGGGPDASPHCVCDDVDKPPITGSFKDYQSSCIFTTTPKGVFTDPVVASNNAAEESSISVAEVSAESASKASVASKSSASVEQASKVSEQAANATPTCECTTHEGLEYGFDISNFPQVQFGDGDALKKALSDHCLANIEDYDDSWQTNTGCDDKGLCTVTFTVMYSPNGCVEKAVADVRGKDDMPGCVNTY